MSHKPVALTIAGSDSSGGAGVQADLKTFHQLGVYGTSALTLVSAQHGAGVDAMQQLPPALVEAQILSVCRNFHVAALKTGALGGAENVVAVLRALRKVSHGPLVVDPVLETSAGDPLLGAAGLDTLRQELLAAADLLTPNLPEAALLLGRPATGETPFLTEPERENAAEALLSLGPRAVLLKGGHGAGPECADLFCDRRQKRWLRAPRRATPHTRGTGCTYSAAITAFLSRGVPLGDAVVRAHRFLQSAIAGAPGAQPTIAGQPGPLDHWASDA